MPWSKNGPAAPARTGLPTIRPRLPTHGGHRPDKTAPTQTKETGQTCPVSKFVRRACAVERQQVFNIRAFLNTLPLAPSSALSKCSTTLFNNSNRSTIVSRVCWTPSALAGSVCIRGSRGQSESEQTPLLNGTRESSPLTAGPTPRPPGDANCCLFLRGGASPVNPGTDWCGAPRPRP